MECLNSLYAENVLNLTQFKDQPNFRDADAAMLWYKRLGMHTFKYPSLHEWQVQLSVKIHLKCQDVFGIVATGAGKSTLIHLPVVADMALGRKTISLVTIPSKALSIAHVCQTLYYDMIMFPIPFRCQVHGSMVYLQ